MKTIGPIIGMLHVPALPGSPRNELGFDAIADFVLRDADALAAGGVDALMLENFGDAPFYPHRVPPHTVAFMTAIACEVRLRFDLPLGINVLRNDAESALAVACAVDAEFIRVNVHTSPRVTDQGLIEGRAHATLRYRRSLGSTVKILADIDVKHSSPLSARPLEVEVEEALARGCADGVIVTGTTTGKQTPLEDLRAAKRVAGPFPVLAGSGVNVENIREILAIADGAIVGTALKRGGVTTHPVEPERVEALMQIVRNRAP
jgi:membrane complex biogenesis BtpA family protein